MKKIQFSALFFIVIFFQSSAQALWFADLYTCSVTAESSINDEYYEKNFTGSRRNVTVEVEAWTEGLAQDGAISYFKESTPSLLQVDENTIVATCFKKD